MALTTAVVEHDELGPREPRSGPAPTRAADAQRLALSMLDRLAATAFVGCDSVDADEFAALTRAAAASLADDDTSAARASRRRLIARLTAIEKTTMTVLMGMLGESVRAGLDDEHARRIAKVLDGLANSSCRRLTMLLGAAEQRASVVSIENALVKVDAV